MAMRVVLDTDVIVSGLAYPNGPPGRIVAAWRGGALAVVLSPWLLEEMRRALPRLPPLAAWRHIDIDDLVDSMAMLADVIEPSAAVAAEARRAVLRDEADQPVLTLLKASGAEWLVSGDKDLLAFGESGPIISPTQFAQRFGV